MKKKAKNDFITIIDLFNSRNLTENEFEFPFTSYNKGLTNFKNIKMNTLNIRWIVNQQTKLST